MPVIRLIILLSTLLVISPMMSQLAMASASHSTGHHTMADGSSMDEDVVKSVKAANVCVCCDISTAQTCPDSGCECDACVSVLIHSLSYSQPPAPQATGISFSIPTPLDTVFAIVVPPPIFIL